MKFKISSISLFFIALSIVPILIKATDTENLSENYAENNSENNAENNSENSESSTETSERNKLSKAEENRMYNMYAEGKVSGQPPSQKIGVGPVYFQGWAKYFHYDSTSKVNRPTDFFLNNAYYSQRVLKAEKSKKDKYGSISIPTKFHFFITLTKDTIALMSSRSNQLQKVVESMQVDLINPIPKDNIYKGGVQVLGEFDEGNCLQILTTIPEGGSQPGFDNFIDQGTSQNWVICLDKVADRTLLMRTIANIKLIKQIVRGESMHTDNRKPSLSNFLHPHKTPRFERYNGPGANKNKDGFWVLLQDWSQCSKKCGTGTQWQHWLCQPPLKGGHPCVGKGIRSRPCNINPCPSVTGKNAFGKKPGELVFKPIMTSLPWSARLQRYIQCEVKETDVMYIRTDIPGRIGKEIKYPGRMVMTNRTLSLYEDDSFERSIFHFNLMDTQLGKYKKDFCCLLINSMDKQFRVCGFQSECGTKLIPSFVNKWIHAYNLFTKKCYVELPRKNWKAQMKKDKEDEDHGHLHIDLPGLAAREGLIKKKMIIQQESDIEKKITSTQELALKAIRKELKLEKLVKNEEKIKEKAKIHELMVLKKKEEKKKDCLLKALKNREDDNKKGRTTKEAELEIARIKNEAKKDVAAERLNLRKKLAEIKKVGKRRRRMLEQQIQLIRSTMAKNLLDANKNGDMKLCKNGSKDPVKAKAYCNSNFVDNFKTNSECKEMDRFCPICCENEFGNLFMNKREECYKICDDIVKDELKGDWIWAPK